MAVSRVYFSFQVLSHIAFRRMPASVLGFLVKQRFGHLSKFSILVAVLEIALERPSLHNYLSLSLMAQIERLQTTECQIPLLRV